MVSLIHPEAMDDLFTMINKMRMTPRYLAWSLLVLYGTSSVVSGARERLRNGAASPFSTMDVTPLERRSLRSLLREQKTFPIPVFSYHMTIVDRDVKLDDFESHLLRITMAHLQTATGAALSSGTSPTLRDIRVDNFHLGANLHRAFTGENLETGEPEALVRCSFTGSVYLSVYGDATTAETEEDGFQQQEELDQIIEGALSNKDLLLQRFSSDSVLNIIEDLTVSVEEPNRQRQKIDASPSWGSDYVIHITGVVLILTFAAFAAVLAIRRALRVLRSSVTARSKGRAVGPSQDDDASLGKEIEALGRTCNMDDDSTSQGSSRSSPVFL
mmetsp:Transcript_3833/g.7670  ORF Transcript_3833/g.7670 Transcript_3833/m.7670 type:complete len:329 (+) Transcript_3833:10-996(+)